MNFLVKLQCLVLELWTSFFPSDTLFLEVFNREKFSRGSRSYLAVTKNKADVFLVVTVTSICCKWLQKVKYNMLQMASKVPIPTKLTILGVT